MIRTVDTSKEPVFEILRCRSIDRDRGAEKIVADIIDDVRNRGDLALLELGRTFDAPNLDGIKVSPEEIESAKIPDHWANAIKTTESRVRRFHERQLQALTTGMTSRGDAHEWSISDLDGRPSAGFETGSIGQRIAPVACAGIYIPGGRAPYASSVLMNAIPASVAGVKRIVFTSPPGSDGRLAQAVLVAIRSLGVSEVFKIGGAGAIAALTFGTESIPRVDSIAGPGNKFVNEAKRQLWGRVGLDGYAGPSEVCILADGDANAAWAAADLLTQIEHAPDNAGFLIVLDQAKADEILAEIERQLTGAKNESAMRQALQNEGLLIVARDLTEAAELVDAIAPEHVTLAVKDPESLRARIHNAGCVLMGEWSAESAGDFAIGPSHTLPTSGAARYGGPVNVLTFLKTQSVANLSRETLNLLTPTIEAFGEMEGFPTHARGATIRFSPGN